MYAVKTLYTITVTVSVNEALCISEKWTFS